MGKNAKQDPGRPGESDFIQQILDCISDPIFVKDREHRWIFGNQAFAEVLGVSRKDFIGKSDYEFIPKDQADVFYHYDELVFRTGKECQNEEQITLPSGEVRTLLTKKTLKTLRNSGDTVLVGIIRDITEIKIVETKLQESMRLAALGQMAGGVAHEINNPLAIIKCHSQQLIDLMREGGDTKEHMHKALSLIDATVDRISGIVNGLLAFARRDKDDELSEVELQTLIDDTLSLCSEKFKKAGIKLSVEGDWQAKVAGKSAQLHQVVLNLMNNSFDAVSHLPVKEIELRAKSLDDEVYLYFTDSGEGIPPEVAANMMNPFFTTKQVGSGTGLGLSISKSIVERFGGKLDYNPNSPHTQFQLRLKRVA